MNYRIRLRNVESIGPFSIWTLSTTQDQFVLFESNVDKDILLQGKIITIPDNTRALRVVNDCNGCGNEKIVYINPALPSPTPTTTPTPTPTPTAIGSNNETTILPPWLLGAAISSDAITYDFSIAVYETQDIQIRVQTLDGTTISGLTTDSLPWNNNTWIEGTNLFATPYDEIFRVNPLSPGYGGLVPGTVYKFMFKRANDNSVIYVKNIQIPFVSQPLTAYDLVTPAPTVTPTATPGQTPTATPVPTPTATPNANLPLCSIIGRAPTLSQVLTAIVTQTTFQFDADNVPRFYVRIKQSGTVIRTTEMVYYANATSADQAAANSGVPTPTVQLFTNNSPTFKYATLTDTSDLTIEIEGSSCRSTPSSKTLTIVSPTPTPTISQSGSPVTSGVSMGLNISVQAGKNFSTVGSQDAKFVILPSGNVKLEMLASRPSLNGSQTCLPIVMGNYMSDLPAAQLAALISSTGLAIPKGITLTVWIYYVNPTYGTTVANMAPNNWTILGNPSTYPSNFGGIERAIIEVF